MHLNSYAMLTIPEFYELGNWIIFNCVINKWFRIRPNSWVGEGISTFEKGDKICVCFAIGLMVQSKNSIPKFVHAKSSNGNKNKNFQFSYLSWLHDPQLRNNVHWIKLQSSYNNTVHLLWNIFHIMFTVTHYIQAAIPLSTCCEESSR